VPEGYVHYEDPFAAPPSERHPARRLRGRLAAGVTLWTAGSPSRRAGLTVSSLVIADGEPPLLLGLVSDASDLFEVVSEHRTFVVHVLARTQKALAERFAGLAPAPGGLFADASLDDSAWGPVLHDVPDRAYCRLVGWQSAGYARLARAEIEEVETSDLTEPLVLFRGRYPRLERRR
jgi:3-hydroxy-9,10-secoandrosta-1,3,5(10)-triene-9,17-dione monooxygenase reductase component